MRPKVVGLSFEVDLTVNERRHLKAAHDLAVLCARLGIKGAGTAAQGISELLGVCGYEGDLEAGASDGPT